MFSKSDIMSASLERLALAFCCFLVLGISGRDYIVSNIFNSTGISSQMLKCGVNVFKQVMVKKGINRSQTI